MGAIVVNAQNGAANSLLTKVDLALSAATVVIQAADAALRPFIDIGSMVDADALATSIELKMGPSGSERSVSDVVATGDVYVTTGIIIGNVNDRIIVIATGINTGKYRITCGFIGPGISGTSA